MKGGCHSSHAFCTDHLVSASGFEADDDIFLFFIIFLTIVYDLMNYNFVSLIVVNIFFSDGLFFTIRLGYEVTKNGIYCVGVVRLVHLRVFEE